MARRRLTRPLAATLRVQSGAGSLAQADRARVRRGVVRRLRDAGVLDDRGYGVFVVAGAPPGPLQEAWAGVLSIGPPCALVGEWALWARRLVPGEPEGAVQIGVPHRRKLVRRNGAQVRRISWWSSTARVDELAHLGGLPVLSALDSLVSAAPHVSDATLLAALQEAVFRGEVRVPDLIARRRRGLPGSPRIGRVTALYLVGHDSAFEVTSYAVLTAGEDTGMHRNVILVDEQGRRVGPVDGYHEDGAGYEADGRAAHSSRRRKARDRSKDNRAEEMEIPLPRFDARDISDGTTARARWLAARAQARRSGVGQRLRVEHLPGRGCPCGQRPAP